MRNYGRLKTRGIPERPNSWRVWCFDERSLERIKENKAKLARTYNKKVKLKEFQVKDLVWESVLPLRTKDTTYEKWSPNWHGSYRIDQVLPKNAYMGQWYALGYTEKGADTWNRPIIKKRKKERGKRIKKEKRKKEYKKRKRKRKRKDTCTIADEQPSTLGVPDFRKVLGDTSP
jgi:hypothetical protein